MPIGEAFLSASLQVLLDKLASPLISELGMLYGIEGDLAKLRRTLKRLQAMLHDAEQNKVAGEQFTQWLRDLKMATCDAEDVLEEFEYEDLCSKDKSRGEGSKGIAIKRLFSTSTKVRKFQTFLSPRQISFRHKMGRRIRDIRSRLDEISKDNELLRNMGGTSDVGVRLGNDTTSLLTVPQVFGRDEVKNELIELLLGKVGDEPSSSSSVVSPSVVAIVGMGGHGKTTLAQCICNTKEVLEYFQPRIIWVHVSQDFNLEKVIKQILQHVVDPPSRLQAIDSLNVLQQNLLEELRGKRFLLILDDVWEDVHSKWYVFSTMLEHGDRGSKILITSRHPNVANTIQSVKKIVLEGLSNDDCWSIFKSHAFTDANSSKHSILEPIGREIVNKLKGVPLAATTIGGLLGCESEEKKWREVLESELWQLEQGGGSIFPALKLSYEYLPHHLKPCFAYCATALKGYRFDVLELVQVWMAQGYIQPQGKITPMEDLGRDYLNALLNRSLIQFVRGEYVVHDLLYDLGRLIVQHDFCQMGPDQVQNNTEDAHSKLHLEIIYKESFMGQFEVLQKFKRLRTLSFWFCGLPYIQIPGNLFHMLGCLRVLDLSASGLDTVPDSISCLKHLRYIDLRRTKIKCLPETLCALYKLQTLKLEGCDELNRLPGGMSNLVNLHYLEAKHELVSKVAKIGKLTNLQNLEVFSISEENGNIIGDLKNMNELHSKLCIQNLHRVQTKEEATREILKDKKHLEILEMEWAEDRVVDNDLEESIIEGLQPPLNLKKLIVKFYAGINFPRWMNSSSISRLESLCLHKCTNLNSLPPFRQQLHYLRTLEITSCPQIKELPHLPKALTNLTLQSVGLNALPNSLKHLPVQQLVLCQILDLKELPLLPATLKELTLEFVGLETLPELCEGHELSTLKIHACLCLTTLHKSLLQHRMTHLQVLSIKGCMELANWPEGDGFRANLCSLVGELTIERCPKLEAFPEEVELHPSLKKLLVQACPGVLNKSFFRRVHNFDSDDVYIERQYGNLEDCIAEALQHILSLDQFDIWYDQEAAEEMGDAAELQETRPSSLLNASIKYDKIKMVSWKPKSSYLGRRLRLEIKERGGKKCSQGIDVNDDTYYRLLSTCLGGHVWTSSLRWLTLRGIPDRAFNALQHKNHCQRGPCGGGGDDVALSSCQPLRLPSLEGLCFGGCREMRRLPMKMLQLSHLPVLNWLAIAECPELTLSAVEEGIRSLPSLEKLDVFRCPKLLLLPSPLISEDSISSAAPPPPARLPLLRNLHIDDAGVLRKLVVNCSHRGQNTPTCFDDDDDGRFFRDHLITSLRVLFITGSELTSLTTDEEDGLRTLASALQFLKFEDCTNLQNLPTDLGALLPNLKILSIENCPEIQFLPDGRLPASLEVLYIQGCSLKKKDRDWHKMAHIPVIGIDGVLLQGSISEFLELKAKWDFVY